jgi:hypothetical protein
MAYLPHDHDDLHADVCADVAAKLPKSAVGAANFVTPELVASLVRTGIDTFVAAFGDRANAAVQSLKPQIRMVLSSNTLAYLERMAQGLEDLKAALPR